jgi:hypothetical protein
MQTTHKKPEAPAGVSAKMIRELEQMLAAWDTIRVETEFRFCPADLREFIAKWKK